MKLKKGFTIVELVIVIAVIAILAAVLVPTFSNIIKKANESSCLQSAKSKFNELYALDYADGILDGKDNDQSMTGENDKVTLSGYDNCKYDMTSTPKTFSYNNGKYTSTLTITSTDNTWTSTEETWETTSND